MYSSTLAIASRMWWRYAVSSRDIDNLSILENALSKIGADRSLSHEVDLLPEGFGQFTLESHEADEANQRREGYEDIYVTIWSAISASC